MNVRTWEVVRVFRDKDSILRRVAEKQAGGCKPFVAERKINLRRLKNHSAENEKSFGADFYNVNYQVVANILPNVFFRSVT